MQGRCAIRNSSTLSYWQGVCLIYSLPVFKRCPSEDVKPEKACGGGFASQASTSVSPTACDLPIDLEGSIDPDTLKNAGEDARARYADNKIEGQNAKRLHSGERHRVARHEAFALTAEERGQEEDR